MQHQKKLIDLVIAADIVKNMQLKGLQVGLCHGCFDVFHLGHLRHFASAKSQCDFLVVSLTPDRFINKGPDRPVFPVEQRSELIAGLSYPDLVVVNQWDSAIELLKLLKPNVFFKGQEYENNPNLINPSFLKEVDVIRSLGGLVKFTYEQTNSSTDVIRRIQAMQQR